MGWHTRGHGRLPASTPQRKVKGRRPASPHMLPGGPRPNGGPRSPQMLSSLGPGGKWKREGGDVGGQDLHSSQSMGHGTGRPQEGGHLDWGDPAKGDPTPGSPWQRRPTLAGTWGFGLGLNAWAACVGGPPLASLNVSRGGWVQRWGSIVVGSMPLPNIMGWTCCHVWGHLAHRMLWDFELFAASLTVSGLLTPISRFMKPGQNAQGGHLKG